MIALLIFLSRSALASPPGEAPGSSTPRSAVSAFLDLTREGRYAEAAELLDVPDTLRGRGPELARELKLVLDHAGWISLETLAASPSGDEGDGLPPDVDDVATVKGRTGQMEPVRLYLSGGQWRFSADTVSRIDSWFTALPDHLVLAHLPDVLLRPGPRELLLWQWAGLLLVVALSWLAGLLLSALGRRTLVAFARRTRAGWDDALVERLSGPLTLLSAALVFYLVAPLLSLYPPAVAFVHSGLRVVVMVGLFWAVLRSLHVVRGAILGSPWARTYPGSRTLIPLGTRTATVAVLALALVMVLSQLGYPVASLLAGLGIGGLALALAAQKTVENLFGAYAIGFDQPIREGDFVKIEDFVGTVERIGLRSTRIRTLDRTIISLPNSKIADMRLETFAERDRIRLATVLGLVYSTRASQIREVLEGIERVLRAHPKIWPDAVVVRFSELAAYSLNIEVMAWFQTSDWGEFQLIRQELLLQFMDVVERAGTGFAFPTQTVELARG